MAVTFKFYNHTAKLFANQEIDVSNLKVMLRNGVTFDATDTVVADLGGTEEFGNGWTEGGEPLTNPAITIDGNDAVLDADNLEVTASGGQISATDGFLIHDDGVTQLVLVEIDFGETKTSDDGIPYQITWNSQGIIKWTVA